MPNLKALHWAVGGSKNRSVHLFNKGPDCSHYKLLVLVWDCPPDREIHPSSLKESKSRWRSIDSTDDILNEEAAEAPPDAPSDATLDATPTPPAHAQNNNNKVNGALEDDVSKDDEDEDEGGSDMSSILENGPEEPLVIKENGWERGDASPQVTADANDNDVTDDATKTAIATEPEVVSPPEDKVSEVKVNGEAHGGEESSDEELASFKLAGGAAERGEAVESQV
jgi:hypothetical protein